MQLPANVFSQSDSGAQYHLRHLFLLWAARFKMIHAVPHRAHQTPRCHFSEPGRLKVVKEVKAGRWAQ